MAVRQLGGEGIVSKRAGSPYRGGVNSDWLKAKVSEEDAFVITGFSERRTGRLEAVSVAELKNGLLVPAGRVQFGFGGKGLWQRLDRLRDGTANEGALCNLRADTP